MSCTTYPLNGVSPPLTINITAVNFTASKTASKCIFQGATTSDKITYTLSVTNNTTAQQSYLLQDLLTSGAFPLGIVPTITTLTGPAIQLVLLTLTPPQLFIPAITLNAGATWTGTATYQPVAGDIGTVIKNTLTVSPGTITLLTLLFLPFQGQSQTFTNTVDYANLTLTETYTPTTVAIGTTIIYSYVLTNNSTTSVNNIVITDNSNPGPAKFLPAGTSNVYTLSPTYTLAPGASTATGDIPNATYLITSNTPITATATATATTICTSGACVVTGSLAGAPYIPQKIAAKSVPSGSNLGSAAAAQTETKRSSNVVQEQPTFNALSSSRSTSDCVSSPLQTKSHTKIIQPAHPTPQPHPIGPVCTNPKKHASHQRCPLCK